MTLVDSARFTTMDTQIDPQTVINDLLDQIKKLTLENSMLRVFVNERLKGSDDAPSAVVLAESE